MFGSSKTTLGFSNEDSNDTIKIVNSLKGTGLLMKGVTEAVESEVKEQNRGFLGMLAALLAFSLLGGMLSGKGVMRAGKTAIRAIGGTIRAGHHFFYHLII